MISAADNLFLAVLVLGLFLIAFTSMALEALTTEIRSAQVFIDDDDEAGPRLPPQGFVHLGAFLVGYLSGRFDVLHPRFRAIRWMQLVGLIVWAAALGWLAWR